MKWRFDHRSYNRNLSNCKFKPEKKKLGGFNGIRTYGLCVSAAVLYQLSYEDPYIGSRPIYWVYLNPWQEYRMRMMWTAEIQMKWRFDHRSYNRNLSNCKFKPEKNFWASTEFESMASALALQCSINWAMKTHILGAGQFIEFILTRDRNIEWRWCELRKYMKWRFDHRSYNRNLSNCKFTPEKNFWASTGFEPMASALALQCSTNWAMKTHILGAGQFIEFILTRDRNIEWRWCELRKYKWNEDLTEHRSYNRNLSNCKFKPEKQFLGFNGIRTHGLCVSAAVLYQLSYEDPYIGSRPIYWVYLNPWQQYRMKMMWTAEIQMNINEDLTIAVIIAI